MPKFNFLLVEDEALIREGLRALLEKEDFVKAVYDAGNKLEFIEALKKQIDVVIMDFRLGETNGLELLKFLKHEVNGPKVIMLTGLEGTELVLNLLLAGVQGIVYKLDGYKEIVKTIRKVLETGNYYSEKVMNIIQANAHRLDLVPPVVLTLPEKDLLRAIAGGFTSKAVASLLKITEATAETYRIRLIKKVGVSNTAGLVAYAYRNGIL